MSAISIPISRKRPYSPGLRDSRTDSESNLPQKKKLRYEDVPDGLKTRLAQLTDWFLDLKPINKWAKMAFKYGASTFQETGHETHLDTDDDDDDGEVDDIIIDDDDDDDDDDEIQEIKENVIQEPSLVNGNGSYFHGITQYNSHRHNGVIIRDCSTRYHGKTNCPLMREPVDKLKRKPLVSNPLEVSFGDEVIVLKEDDIEILSESSSSNQKSASSPKSLHSPVKSPQNTLPVMKSNLFKKSSLPSKLFTANEVVRLQEKAQYKLLLEKYVNGPQPRHILAAKSIKESEGVQPVKMVPIDTMHFKKHVLEQPVARFFEKYYKPCQLLPPKESASDEEKKKPIEITLDDDDEVQIVEMKKPNHKSVFNSSLFTSSWLSELQQNVCEATKETNKVMEEYESRLENLKTERLLHKLKIEFPESEPDAEFPELTEEMEEIVDNLLTTGAPNDLIYRTANSELLRKDFDTLTSLHWLNDAIINSYFDLIIERSNQEGYPSVFAFNTFFYTNLRGKGYSAVRRWTRKIDIFSFDIVFVPIHLTYHWCLGVIDNRSKRICYYDSMGTGEEECLRIFHEYLISERKDKKNEELNPGLYTLETMRDIPQQMNGSDCGMFTLKYAEYLSRNAKITFNQSHMKYFRRRAIYELLTKQIL